MSTGTDIVNFMRSIRGKYLYNQAGDRLHPEVSGVCDCSSCAADAYEECGVVIKDADRWTGNDTAGLASLGRLITTNASDIINGKGLQDGDLLFMRWAGTKLASAYHQWHHVGVIDVKRLQVIDQYGDVPPRETGPDGKVHGHGPEMHTLASWVGRCDKVMVRRLLPDEDLAIQRSEVTGPTVVIEPRTWSTYATAPTKIAQELAGVTADGAYGPQTTAAVKAMQAKLGVTVDGSFGPKTLRAKLGSLGWFGIGAKGAHVKAIQWLAGDDTPDGVYGPQTEGWVDAMRRARGLSVTGVDGVGKDTVEAIIR